MGKVTARAVGVALISASAVCCNAADTVRVVVRQVVASVAVTPSNPSVDVGATVQLSATPQDSAGNPVSGVSVAWSSSSLAIATVNNSGVVQGVSGGNVTITATSQGQAGTTNLTVNGVTTPPTVDRINISPSSATLYPNQQRQFTASADMSDGSQNNSVVVIWSATGGSATSIGLYTAGGSTGSFRVIALHAASGEADTATVSIISQPAPGSFPAEYSLNRPLLANNPGALLHGYDWQGMTQSQLNGIAGHVGFSGPNASTTAISDSRYSSGGPAGFRAELASDPTFVQVLRNWQTDGGSSQSAWDVRNGYSWTGVNKCWYRYTMKFEPGFTNGGVDLGGGGGNAWKVMFGTVRHHVFQSDNYVENDILGPPAGTRYNGNQSYLPGAPQPSGPWTNVANEFSDGEWYEFIVYEEWSQSEWRVRRWIRRITTNGVLNLSAPVRDRFGMVATNHNVPSRPCNGVQLGINRNMAMSRGQVQWYTWGPWEVIDGDRIADPYGFANDMR